MDGRDRWDRRDDGVERAGGEAPSPCAKHVVGPRDAEGARDRLGENAIAQAGFNDLSHWGYGTSWGVVRGLLGAAGLPHATAGAAAWDSAQVMLPALDIAPPSVFRPRQEIAIDLFHHALYALATEITYDLLSGSDRGVTAGRYLIRSSPSGGTSVRF